MLAFCRTLFQQGFDGRLLFGGRLSGSSFCILGLSPGAQEHGNLKTLIGIGCANSLRSGNNDSFASLQGDVFFVICHRLLSIPGAGMERESWTGEEGMRST